MWKCRKCGKAVYFAERKTSLGYDWHPECLRCEECGKILNPGQHSEHKGVPYCNLPCYSVLFGPSLYGHGSIIESHKSFGKPKEPETQQGIEKPLLLQKLKEYNAYFQRKQSSNVINCRERNGKLVLEGSVRIYWDVSKQLILKEENDDRLLVQRRRTTFIRKRTCKGDRLNDPNNTSSSRNGSKDIQQTTDYKQIEPSTINNLISKTIDPAKHRNTLSTKCLQVSKDQSADDSDKTGSEHENRTDDNDTDKTSTDIHKDANFDDDNYDDDVDDEANLIDNGKENESNVVTKSPTRCSIVRGGRVGLKRRCSINGHYYNRETCVFTPVQGSVTSVWITNLVDTIEVINLLLDKFKVINKPHNFSLFIVRDNGECRRLMEHEYPLLTRVILGPDEAAARFYILNKDNSEVSNEVAQYLNFSNAELQVFLEKYAEQEQKEIEKVRNKYNSIKQTLKQLIEAENGSITKSHNNESILSSSTTTSTSTFTNIEN